MALQASRSFRFKESMHPEAKLTSMQLTLRAMRSAKNNWGTRDSGLRGESNILLSREARFQNGRSYRTESPVTQDTGGKRYLPGLAF
jgi:hypothetical protein